MKTVDACERLNDVLFAVSRSLVVSIDHRVLLFPFRVSQLILLSFFLLFSSFPSILFD